MTAYRHTTRNINEPDAMDQHWNEADLHRLHEAARNRARQLRAEAISDFWESLHAALDAASDSAARATRRLAHRIRSHRALRQARSGDQVPT